MALQSKRKQARAILLRILQIGAAVGLTVGVVAFAARTAVPAVFTQDVQVSAEVQRVLPMVALFMVSAQITRSFSCQTVIAAWAASVWSDLQMCTGAGST